MATLGTFFFNEKMLCTNFSPDFFSCLSLILKLVKPLTSNKQCWVSITHLKNLAHPGSFNLHNW